MVETTGGFTSAQLALEAQTLVLPSLSQAEAIEIGEIAAGLGRDRVLPIAVEVRLGEWIVFHISLPGAKPENDWWIARKARVVMAKGTSTMFERVAAEEAGVLVKNNQLTVHLDVAHRGLGTASCGPDTLEQYRIAPGRYEFSYTVGWVRN